MKIDMLNSECKECDDGFYMETSINDDIRGVLHCNHCNEETRRWKEISNVKEQQPE